MGRCVGGWRGEGEGEKREGVEAMGLCQQRSPGEAGTKTN